MLNIVFPFATAFIISLLLTPTLRAVASNYGFMAEPSMSRWHKKPKPLLGGAAIAISFYIGALLFLKAVAPVWIAILIPLIPFSVGLWDDLQEISPQTKLVGIIVAAAVLIALGYQLAFTDIPPLNIFITIIWILGITNAMNLLDNMDGLSAGIAFIATSFLIYFFAINGRWEMVTVTALFSGSLLGFLIYNFHPASIFMGDAGSLFIGFLLSALPMATGFQPTTSLFSVLIVPALILLIPIFDTTFVTIMRILTGRAVSQGGKDHTSHRLVAIGLTEKEAVLTLYVLSFFTGGLALLVRVLKLHIAIAIIPLCLLVLVFLGAYLGRMKPYSIIKKRKGPVFPILVDIAYKRRMLEVIMDFFLVGISYYSAYLIRFEGTLVPYNLSLLLSSLPIVIASKMTAFFALGMYKGVWRYAGLNDIVTYFKATALGSIISLFAILFIYHFSGFSRSVFIIDWLILFVAVLGSRFSYQLLDRISRMRRKGKRVLIYGAGDGGSFALLEMLNNQALGMVPVGFVDDDDSKVGRKIHGYTVLGRSSQIAGIIRRRGVSELVISSPKINGDRIKHIEMVCNEQGVPIRTMNILWSNHRPGTGA